MNRIEWKGFKPGSWQTSLMSADFIRKNYTPMTRTLPFSRSRPKNHRVMEYMQGTA